MEQYNELNKLCIENTKHIEDCRPKCNPIKSVIAPRDWDMTECDCLGNKCRKCGQDNTRGCEMQCTPRVMCDCIVFYCNICNTFLSVDTLPDKLPTCRGHASYDRNDNVTGYNNDALLKELGIKAD
uniref:Uncharacterized protein n=1 Tax=viral metagenome TaxID=1070528 RepID=A0A6C0J7D6_9ZZZZ